MLYGAHIAYICIIFDKKNFDMLIKINANSATKWSYISNVIKKPNNNMNIRWQNSLILFQSFTATLTLHTSNTVIKQKNWQRSKNRKVS